MMKIEQVIEKVAFVSTFPHQNLLLLLLVN